MKILKVNFWIPAVLFALISIQLSGQKSYKKPNLVLILADDLGYADLGMHGSKQIPTPNIDGISEAGIMFTNGYVSSPVCSPSRAGLMTGRNQASFGHVDNLVQPGKGYDPEYVGLPVTETTLAERLKELGYINGLIGKWHLGELPQFYPTNRGFDEYWGFLAGGHDYFADESMTDHMKSPMECTFKTPDPVTYLTDDIGDESVAFIERHKGSPFFLFASFNAPHGPIQALDADIQKFSHIDDKLRRTYCAMVYRLDINVGKVLDAIRDAGVERNTIVVFMSDNGGPVYQISNGSLNAPLRGQKTTVLEGGIRVPFVIKWPARLEAGRKVDDMILSLDIMPTFIKAAGGEITGKENFRGVDIMPFLLGETTEIPHQSMEWKYTVGTALRDGDWKIVSVPDRFPMLYHLSEDISELNDLALQYPDRTREMLKRLGTWDVYLPHPLFHEPADWRRRHLRFYDVEYQLTQPE